MLKRLELRHSTSRGRDTYGYNIVTLTDTQTQKSFRTCGGGYDMTGTVLADWMGYELQTDLFNYLKSKGMKDGDRCSSGQDAQDKKWPYGCYIHKGKAGMDGACGQSSVKAALKDMGYEVQETHIKKRGQKWPEMTGYIISKD